MNPRETFNKAFEWLPPPLFRPVARLNRSRKIRFSRITRSWERFLTESETWDAERLAAFQAAQLSRTLHHAYEHVPYYRRRFVELGAHPSDFRAPSDLHRFPLLTKAHLQEEGEQLLADDVPARNRKYDTTGGSTGIPVSICHDSPRSPAANWAFTFTMWKRVGYREFDPMAVIRGHIPRDGRLWEPEITRNALRLSSYHLTDEYLGKLVERLHRFRPRFVHAYPTSAAAVARYMLERGIEPPPGLHAVLSGSERLYDEQRTVIEAAFRCRAFAWYGQREQVCLAAECEYDHSLHIFPQYGFTELIDEQGNPITAPHVPGEIVGTGFISRAMPLVRYRTMDYAVLADGPCPECGRAYPRFERVDGRAQDFIVSEHGRRISMTAMVVSTVFENVIQFRYYQDTPGQVVLRLVPNASYTPERDEVRIRSVLEPRLGDIRLEAIELVSHIPPSPNGKHLFLEQRIPPAG